MKKLACIILATLTSLSANTNLDSQEIDSMLESHIDSLLSKKFVKNIQKQKVIAISDIENATGEMIDIQLIIAQFKQHIYETQENLVFTKALMGSGDRGDKILKDSRKLRDNEEFNQYTTKEKGELLAPDYSLSGKITKKSKQKGKKTLLEYQFLLTLVDTSTGIEVWSNIAKISKTIKNNEFNSIRNNSQKSKMSEEEWNRAFYNCLDNEDKNACQALIDNGLLSVGQCDKESCGFFGSIYYQAGHSKEAIPYFEKAIALGDNRGYGALGIIYGTLQDYHKARELYKKACDMKDGNACNSLGVLYGDGLGVRQNLSTAKQYFGKACDFGEQAGCGNYKLLHNQGVR